ncbi:helix-turn-helix domain-containing protein [Kutzneria sp. 744]|uniref:helix-turn-helix domain-containing protein n=1 Tax=Kutzneria sp. (strain 744) TaxID=345341 RepID=UPI0004BA2827
MASDVGDFLKARRAELTPRDVGLSHADEHRRVAGLRREEVAQLASISVDYYTRLEQGRVAASSSVLATLARVLRLADEQQTYLYAVAGKAPAKCRRDTQRVRPAMRRLLDQLTDAPALVLGRRLDILAWNRLAGALFADFDALPPPTPRWSASLPCRTRTSARGGPRTTPLMPATASSVTATPSPAT